MPPRRKSGHFLRRPQPGSRGHGAFRENYFSDDGAYIAVKIICRLARLRAEGRQIEDMIADLGQPAESREVRFQITKEDFAAYGKGLK